VGLLTSTHDRLPPAPLKLRPQCQTPSKRRTDGQTDAANYICSVCTSVRPSVS